MKQLFLSFTLGFRLRLGDCRGEGPTSWLASQQFCLICFTDGGFTEMKFEKTASLFKKKK